MEHRTADVLPLPAGGPPRRDAGHGRAKTRRAARGVGAVVHPALADFLLEHPAALDYVALTPEALWTEHGADVPAALATADALAARYPVVLHGTGLSVGSAMPLDEAHLARVAQAAARYGATRYGERLGFSRVPTAPGRSRCLGLAMPLPCDEAVLDWLAPRVRRAGCIAGLPLLLENGAHRTPYADEDMPEPVFLNRLAAASGCGVLLNLHHLLADGCRPGTPPQDYLAQLDLRLVREIRVDGAAPPVLALLLELVPRCPALEGITCALDACAARRGGPQALQETLDALTLVWSLRAMAARDALAAGDCHVA